MSDFIKGPVLIFGYLVVGPMIGIFLQQMPQLKKWVFALMIFMTSWHINKITMMLGSVAWYRGHTKGFEFSSIEILSIALIVACYGSVKDKPKTTIPPGVIIWLLYCAVSWLSIFAAPNATYVLMAGWKFTKCILIMIAAYAYVKEEKDVAWMLKSFVVALAVQAIVSLKMKYVDGFYQIRGWFEHQNPFAMWAYMLGIPMFAAAMSKVSIKDTIWYTIGFLSAAIIVQSALSRAALAVFAVGVAGAAGWSLLDKFTLKRIGILIALGILGMIGAALVADTIIARFNDEGNEASGETRDVMNAASLAMVKDSPIGLGWNNFALTINHPFPYGDVIDDWSRDRGHKVDEDYAKGVVESHYWLLLAETGYLSLFFYLLFIAVINVWCLIAMWVHRGTFLAAFMAGIMISFTLTYLHSNLERVLTQTKNLASYMILVGAAAAIEQARRNKTPFDGESKNKIKPTIVIGAYGEEARQIARSPQVRARASGPTATRNDPVYYKSSVP